MIVKLLTEHHLEFLSLKGGCRGSYESTLVKMSNCWQSHAAAYLPRIYQVVTPGNHAASPNDSLPNAYAQSDQSLC